MTKADEAFEAAIRVVGDYRQAAGIFSGSKPDTRLVQQAIRRYALAELEACQRTGIRPHGTVWLLQDRIEQLRREVGA